MFKFLHAADIHLDSPMRGLEDYADAPVEQLRQATRRAFDNLVDLALAEKAAFLLIVGDLYDGDWKDYNTGLYFISRMARLRREGIRVFLVSGNHDAASHISKNLELPDNVHLFTTESPETVRLEELGVALHGQGYQNRAVAENLAADYPQGDPHYFNIGLLHTSLTGREGHEPYAPCSLDDLRARGYAYWALGHVHKREEVASDPWVIFPGNLQGRHIHERGSKGATLVTVSDGSVLSREHRVLDVVRWEMCRLDVSECDSLDQVRDAVRAGLEKQGLLADGRPVALRLELVGRTALYDVLQGEAYSLTENFRGLAAGLGDIWLEKVVYATQRLFPLEETLEEGTPVADLIRSLSGFTLAAGDAFELIPELATLKSKLPPELLAEEAIFADVGTTRLAEEVRELLLTRLLRQHGGGQ